MPRLTDQQYLDRRKVVFREWFIHGVLFARMPLREQHALHTYFATEENLQRTDLLAHRMRVTTEQPALAQEAGRAFHDLELLRAGERSERVQQHQTSLTQRVGSGRRQRNLIVLPIARPTPDERRLVRTLAAFSQTPEFEKMTGKEVHR